jgi:CO/xanthine dehydrogenase FAD-binding subunit
LGETKLVISIRFSPAATSASMRRTLSRRGTVALVLEAVAGGDLVDGDRVGKVVEHAENFDLAAADVNPLDTPRCATLDGRPSMGSTFRGDVA